MKQVQVGALRETGDKCRRYMPLAMQFDTREHLLTTEISQTWEESVREQWLANRQNIRMGLIHEYGNKDHERKINDFVAMGSAPWSLIGEHNAFLHQIRDAFTFGSYYPALVGACSLGERLLNELVIKLRGDYADHPATTHDISRPKSFQNWVTCIKVLVDWSTIDDRIATDFNNLRKLRNKSVHFGRHLSGTDGRPDALRALLLVQDLVGALFNPFGGPPRFIEGVTGRSFLSLDSEADPFVRHFYIPACVLVSPNFEMRPTEPDGEIGFAVFDDDSYQLRFPILSDTEFAEHLKAPR
jgi:hypothetical protein